MIFKYRFTNGGWVAALVSVALLGLALLLGSVVAVWPVAFFGVTAVALPLAYFFLPRRSADAFGMTIGEWIRTNVTPLVVCLALGLGAQAFVLPARWLLCEALAICVFWVSLFFRHRGKSRGIAKASLRFHGWWLLLASAAVAIPLLAVAQPFLGPTWGPAFWAFFPFILGMIAQMPWTELTPSGLQAFGYPRTEWVRRQLILAALSLVIFAGIAVVFQFGWVYPFAATCVLLLVALPGLGTGFATFGMLMFSGHLRDGDSLKWQLTTFLILAVVTAYVVFYRPLRDEKPSSVRSFRPRPAQIRGVNTHDCHNSPRREVLQEERDPP